jgi:hypothetical protein
MNTAVECLSVGTFHHHNDFEDPALIPSSCFGFSPLVCSCTGPISILYVTTTKLIYNSKACFGPKNIQLRSITSKPASALLLSCYEAWFRPWAVTSHVPFLFILEQRKRSPTLFWSPRNYLGGFHEIIALQNYLIEFFYFGTILTEFHEVDFSLSKFMSMQVLIFEMTFQTLRSHLSAIFITLRNPLAELLRSSSLLRHTTKSSYIQATAASVFRGGTLR